MSRWWNSTERRSRWRSTAVRQNCAERRSARQRTGWVRCCSTSAHANDVDQAWASSRTREELDQVVEPFVQAKRQTGQWTQEDEAGYQLYRQETDPKKRTFRVWYLIAKPPRPAERVCPERAGVSVETVPRKEGGTQMSNKAFQQNLDDKKGPQPGGPYLIQMLFKEPVEMPDKEK